jgi:hypothetical protein
MNSAPSSGSLFKSFGGFGFRFVLAGGAIGWSPWVITQ